MADIVTLEGVVLETYVKPAWQSEEDKKAGKVPAIIKCALLFQKGNKRNIEVKNVNGQCQEGQPVELVCKATPWAQNGKAGISYTCIEGHE